MPHLYEGALDARGLRVALVVSRTNELLTERLLQGSLDCMRRHGAADDDLHVVRVPGGFELPLLARQLAASGAYDAVVCLGAVIRGDTPHFDYIASEVARGVARTAYETGVPVGFGVLTTDTLEQAVERAGAKSGNKGWDAALSVIETVQVLRAVGTGKKSKKPR